MISKDQSLEKNNKLPKVDIYFWIMLITATTVGETAGDLISMTLGVGYAVSSVILIGLFLLALIFELFSKSQHPALFWTVIILTSTAGTTVADYINRTLAFGYTKGTLLLLVILAAIFGLWRLLSNSLAIENVKSVKTEILYWAAILFSSTMGTALGDYIADEDGLGLGFGKGTLLLAALIVLTALTYFFTKVSRVFLFWAAIVVTHPIGATTGDLFTKPSGFNLGPISATLILLGIFAAVSVAIYFKKRSELTPTPS